MKFALERLFGSVEFGESEEHLEFQYRFLIVLLVAGAAITTLFLIGHISGFNPLPGPHPYSMAIFIAISNILWLILRNRPRLIRSVAWAFEVTTLFECVSTIVFVPQDELRILWLYVNLPALYMILGPGAGRVVTIFTIAILIVCNSVAEPAVAYSSTAMATAIVAVLYLGLYAHVFVDRSISYYRRMRDSSVKLRQMAMHDSLTGLYNGRAYYEFCDSLIEAARRTRQVYSVLFVDLDHFKSINDQHGHAAGDLVLKAVAACLAHTARCSDIVGRIGGEEFSLFLPATDIDGALLLGERLRAEIEALNPSIGERRLRVTASIGVAASMPDESSMQTLQLRADQAMYQAKAAGRNRVSSLDAITTAS